MAHTLSTGGAEGRLWRALSAQGLPPSYPNPNPMAGANQGVMHAAAWPVHRMDMPSVTFFTSSTSTWFSSPANSLSSVRKSLRPAHARLAQPRGAEHAAHIGVAAAWEWQRHGSGRSVVAHAVAVVPLPHGHTGAVPEAILRLRLLVLVVPARAERGAQRHLVLRQPLEHHLRPVCVCVRVGLALGRVCVCGPGSCYSPERGTHRGDAQILAVCGAGVLAV